MWSCPGNILACYQDKTKILQYKISLQKLTRSIIMFIKIPVNTDVYLKYM